MRLCDLACWCKAFSALLAQWPSEVQNQHLAAAALQTAPLEIESIILEVRGHKVILEVDLALSEFSVSWTAAALSLEGLVRR
jgi:hypothetical protein